MRRTLGLALLLLAWASPSWGAIAFVTKNSGTATSGTTLTVSLTTSGTNTHITCSTGYDDSSHTTTVSATYNGVALAGIDTQTVGAFWSTALLHLIAPAAGTHDAVFTYSASITQAIGGCVVLEGVHQTTAIGTPVKASGSSSTATVDVTVGTGEWAIDGFHNSSLNPATSTQTQRWEKAEAVSGSDAGQATSASTGTVTMSWTLAGSTNWGIIAVPIKPAASGAVIPARAISQ